MRERVRARDAPAIYRNSAQTSDAFDVRLDGGPCEIAEGHVLDHAAARGVMGKAPMRVNGAEVKNHPFTMPHPGMRWRIKIGARREIPRSGAGKRSGDREMAAVKAGASEHERELVLAHRGAV